MSDWKSKQKQGLAFLHGATVGSLATSTGFWFAFGEWKPMVIAACVAVAIEIFVHLIKALE